MFVEGGSTGFLASESLLTRTMTTTVLYIFLNIMKLFVYEGGDCPKVVETQFQSRQWRSITRIRDLLLRSLTAVTLQPRVPDETVNCVTDSVPQQGPAAGNDDVPTTSRQQQPLGTSDDVISAASVEEMEKAVYGDAIEAVSSTNNFRTCR